MHSKDLPSQRHPWTHPALGGHSASGRPGSSAYSGNQFKASAQTAPSGLPHKNPAKLEPLSESEKAAIRNRAKSRTRVPPKFRDSFKHFFFSPTGVLKVLRLGLLIGSAVCFFIAEAHQSYIVITVQEIFIVLFFILIYMLTLHRLLTYIHWPLLDIINSFITTVFLLIAAVFAMQEKERRHLLYVGGSLCLGAVIVCLLDAMVVTKKMRTRMKNMLRIQGETSSSPAPAEPAPQSGKELSAAPSLASSRAPSRAPSQAQMTAPPSHY